MNKKAYYFLGLGSGLILGAILIQLMSAAGNPQPVDEAALEEAAQRYGYRLVDDNQEVRLADPDTVIRSVYIPPGLTNEQVGEMLTSAQLLQEPAAYMDELEQRAELWSVQPGYYEFIGQPSLEELIAAITAQ